MKLTRGSVVLLVLLAACSSSTTIPVDGPKRFIRVSPDSATIYVGQSQSLSAVSVDDAGDSIGVPTVTWSASPAAVASVSDGFVTGLAAGVTTVVATTGLRMRDSSQITVVDQPCGKFAQTQHLRGRATFRYTYAATLEDIQYAVDDSATMDFTAVSEGVSTSHHAIWLASVTGAGAEQETRTDHSDNTVQTLTGSGALFSSDFDYSYISIDVDLSTCTYTIEGSAYIDVTKSPTPGDIGESLIGMFRTAPAPLDSASHSASLATHSANWDGSSGLTKGWYVPGGFSSDYFDEGAPDDGSAGVVSITFSVAHAN